MLEEKFSKVHSILESKETMQILESINVLWAGYCSSLDDSSLAMTVDANWDMPVERVVNTVTNPSTQYQSTGVDEQIDADAQLAEELDETQRRRSSRHSHNWCNQSAIDKAVAEGKACNGISSGG